MAQTKSLQEPYTAETVRRLKSHWEKSKGGDSPMAQSMAWTSFEELARSLGKTTNEVIQDLGLA